MQKFNNLIENIFLYSCAATVGAVVIATVATFTAIGLSGAVGPALSAIGLS